MRGPQRFVIIYEVLDAEMRILNRRAFTPTSDAEKLQLVVHFCNASDLVAPLPSAVEGVAVSGLPTVTCPFVEPDGGSHMETAANLPRHLLPFIPAALLRFATSLRFIRLKCFLRC